ncbi:MAG TPA: NAD(P)/FAD-dependent oxidoreductase [Syntrophales bacterium]|nr:NAD(P)/FAD-dependent oxidoreductase [Syntrophales bacterium]
MVAYPRLFAPIKINRLRLSNRIVMAPMASNFADEKGGVTDQLLEYYRQRARGRPGMMIPESCYVSPEGRGALRRFGLASDDVIAGHRRLTDVVHESNVRICAQLHHAGFTAPMHVIGQYPVSCSTTVLQSKGQPFVGVIPTTLSEADIATLIVRYGRAARRALEAGYDAVQIHAAHGYLINQFLSPHTNIRNDAYGGSEIKRMRFLLDVVKEIRRAVPPDFPVTCRLSGAEFHDGGYRTDFVVALAKRLEEEGIDEITISAGNYERLDLIGPQYPNPMGCYTGLSEIVKQAVRIPVGVVGRIGTPARAEEILAKGKADLIYLGRELIADPDWPIKASEGRDDEIRPCIFCNLGCFDRMMNGQEIRCAVNAAVGCEFRDRRRKRSRKKRLLIVGGGPAGLQAACFAAERGYEVHLMEKTARLGGKLHVAARPEGKEQLQSLCSYLIGRIEELGVQVHLGQEMTEHFVKRIRPERIVLAVGAKPYVPDIPGIGSPNVFMAEDVLSGAAAVGSNVAVIGGGIVGVETAMELQDRGKRVVVIEALDDILSDQGSITKKNFLLRLGKRGIPVLVATRIVKINRRSLTIRNVLGEKKLPIDSVVIATGYKADIPQEVAGGCGDIPTVAIGDARKAGALLNITQHIQEELMK